MLEPEQSDSTRALMRQLMGAVAQYDKSQIVAKLRGARMRYLLRFFDAPGYGRRIARPATTGGDGRVGVQLCLGILSLFSYHESI